MPDASVTQNVAAKVAVGLAPGPGMPGRRCHPPRSTALRRTHWMLARPLGQEVEPQHRSSRYLGSGPPSETLPPKNPPSPSPLCVCLDCSLYRAKLRTTGETWLERSSSVHCFTPTGYLEWMSEVLHNLVEATIDLFRCPSLGDQLILQETEPVCIILLLIIPS